VLVRRLVGLSVLVLGLAACGGSSGGSNGDASGGGGASSRTPSLVAKVSDAKVAVDGSDEVASAKVSVGGVAGRKLTLQWGLVDALQGNESQDEIVLHRYVSTKNVVSGVQSVRIPLSRANTPLLVHFVLYDTDGAYLASDDTPQFGKGS
jgi:hypothetical protein